MSFSSLIAITREGCRSLTASTNDRVERHSACVVFLRMFFFFPSRGNELDSGIRHDSLDAWRGCAFSLAVAHPEKVNLFPRLELNTNTSTAPILARRLKSLDFSSSSTFTQSYPKIFPSTSRYPFLLYERPHHHHHHRR